MKALNLMIGTLALTLALTGQAKADTLPGEFGVATIESNYPAAMESVEEASQWRAQVEGQQSKRKLANISEEDGQRQKEFEVLMEDTQEMNYLEMSENMEQTGSLEQASSESDV